MITKISSIYFIFLSVTETLERRRDSRCCPRGGRSSADGAKQHSQIRYECETHDFANGVGSRVSIHSLSFASISR